MIIAYLNGSRLHVDESFAVGITIENFNLSDIANRKLSRSNTFNVPKAGNETVFDFSSIENAPSDFAYNDYDFDLIVDGDKVYDNGRAFVVSEEDDYYIIQVTNGKNIIDLLKSINLADLYTGETIIIGDVLTFKTLFTHSVNGFKADYLSIKEIAQNVDEYLISAGNCYLSIYLDTILTKIETDYDITFSGALLADAEFLDLRMLCVASNFKRDNGTADIYIDDLIIHDSLTAWDLIRVIMQLFCAVFKIDGIDMELQKFNDLDITTPTDWSGKLISKKKGFAIPGIAQKNYLKYAAGDTVDELAFSAEVDCNNVNIQYEKDFAAMPAKIFSYVDENAGYTNASANPLLIPEMPEIEVIFPGLAAVPDPSRIKGLKDLVIFATSDEYLGQPITVKLQYYYEQAAFNWITTTVSFVITVDSQTRIVKYYDPSANYSLVETILTDPVIYETELMLSIIDIYEFDIFKAVTIKELGGLFYVNKINEFLITSQNKATPVTLIKIS